MSHAQEVLDRIVHAAEVDGFGAHAVHVLVGDDDAEHHWSPDVRRDIHSAAKAVCTLAAGIASDDGLFDVDAPVAAYLPDARLGDGVADVTTRHLLTMTSGIDLPWTPTLLADWPDLALEYLSRPSCGREFQYSNASTYTAMRALATVAGDVHDFVAQRLLEPLGIDDTTWDRCPLGFVAAGEGLHLRAAELARIGRLVRDDGTWDDERIVSARWPDALRTDWSTHDASPAYARYSLGAWGGPGAAWRLHGAYGRLVVFVDDADAVVTITADDHAGADRMAERVVEAVTAVADHPPPPR